MDTITVKEYTVRSIYEAIDKQGFEYVRGAWFHYDKNGNATGGCALGLVALALSANGGAIEHNGVDLSRIAQYYKNPEGAPYRVFEEVPGIIDRALTIGVELTVQAQLDRFPVPPESRWYHSGIPCGQSIVYWNDLPAHGHTTGYYLPTFQDVRNMAKEILEPYMNEPVYLQEITRPFKMPTAAKAAAYNKNTDFVQPQA